MALKDLFDGDSRSKQQLRDEMENLRLALEKANVDLMAQRDAEVKLKCLLVERDSEVSLQATELKDVTDALASTESIVSNLKDDLNIQLELRETLKRDFERLKAEYILAQKEPELDSESSVSQHEELDSAQKKIHALESVIDELKKIPDSMAQRESNLYKNFEELQRREAVLANATQELAEREMRAGLDVKKAVETKNREILDELKKKSSEVVILKADLRETSRELREIKFIYDSMWQPYKDKAQKEGRSVVEVQVADLQEKLFKACEEIFEIREKGAPELQLARKQLDTLKQQIERQSSEIRTHEKNLTTMQRKLDAAAVSLALAQDKEAAADKRTDSVRKDSRTEIAKLIAEHSARSISLKDLECELVATKSRLRASQESLATLEAFNQTLTRENVRKPASNRGENYEKSVLPLSKSDKLFYPEKWKNSTVLAWMLKTTNPEDCGVKSGYLALVGNGPWKRDSFGEVLEASGFSLWSVPDSEVGHMIVGTENWTPEELESQIDAAADGKLRIYSQEMWFAFLITGRDPFDSDDEKLMLAFAEEHPALQYLINREFPWPTASLSRGMGVEPPPPGDMGVLESPMHMLDYRVGATSPHDESSRREILRTCFCAVRLPFGGDCSGTYRAAWGGAKSAQRLYRMAVHIKFLIEGPSGRDYRKPQAAADWASDLEWLRVTYFKKPLRIFDWPHASM